MALLDFVLVGVVATFGLLTGQELWANGWDTPNGEYKPAVMVVTVFCLVFSVSLLASLTTLTQGRLYTDFLRALAGFSGVTLSVLRQISGFQ